jgi:hypothetical protein
LQCVDGTLSPTSFQCQACQTFQTQATCAAPCGWDSNDNRCKWATCENRNGAITFADYAFEDIVEDDRATIGWNSFSVVVTATRDAEKKLKQQGMIVALDRQGDTGNQAFHMNINARNELCVLGPGLEAEDLCITEALEKGKPTRLGVTRDSDGTWTLCRDGSTEGTRSHALVEHRPHETVTAFRIGSHRGRSKPMRGAFMGTIDDAMFIEGCVYSCAELTGDIEG